MKTPHFLWQINFRLTISNYLWLNECNQSIAQLDHHCGSSDGSEEISAEGSEFYHINLCDSDVAESSEPSEEEGLLLYHYEPRRVQQDDEQQQQSREDETKSKTDHLSNTDW